MTGNLLWLAVGVAMLALIGNTSLRMAGYFDRRLSNTQEKVQADIERYGADASGIRPVLLSPEERQQVWDARREAQKPTPTDLRFG